MSEETLPRLALFEDDPTTIRSLTQLLSISGYQIPEEAVASNIDQAKELVPQLPDLQVIAALVDGKLTEGAFANWEGNYIARIIHELNITIPVIGFASMGEIEGADYQVGKAASPQVLLGVLDQIAHPKS
jgi:hypothetical protein